MATLDELREAGIAVLIGPGSPLKESMVRTRTSNAGLLVDAGAAMAQIVAREVVAAQQGLFLGSARGDALDRLARDRYGLQRKGAAPSSGTVILSRPTAAYGAISLAAGQQLQVGGVTLQTVETAAFGPADLGPVSVAAQSTRGGLDQAVAAGAAVRMLGAADSSITAAIAVDFSGADDEETDGDLAQRCVDYWIDAQRGTLGAVRNGLLATPGVYRATVQEALDMDGERSGYVEAWIADRAGRSNSVLASLAEEQLDEYRPAGVEVVIRTSSPIYVQIRISGILYAAGQNTTERRQAVKTALLASVNSLGPGEILRLASRLYAVLGSISGITVPSGAILEPVGDLQPEQNETIRTRLDLIEVA